MDGSRFDDLTRELARGTTRRTMVKTGTGVMLAALGFGAAKRSSEAFICRAGGVLCAKDAHCCSGICDSANHRCACPAGETACGVDCVDTDSDVNNCGTCDSVCPTPDNAMPTCDSGSCGFSCNAGFADCNGLGDGCGTNTTNDPEHCSRCDIGCSAPDNATATCTDSTCTYICDEEFKRCGNACIAVGECCADTECDDGNACTTNSCDPDTHQCIQRQIVCPQGGDCTTEKGCDPEVGCTYDNADNGTSCTSGGNKCIIGQTCQEGVCQGGYENPCTDPPVCFDRCGEYQGISYCASCAEDHQGDGCNYPPTAQGLSCGDGMICDGFGSCMACSPNNGIIGGHCADVGWLCCSPCCQDFTAEGNVYARCISCSG